MKEYIAHVRKSDGAIQTVLQHILETANFAGMFSEKFGSKDLGELVGLLHDLGKFSTEFFNYISSATGIINEYDDGENYIDAKSKKGKIDHSTAGAQIFQELFLDKFINPNQKQELFSMIVNLAVISHHSGLIDCLDIYGMNNYRKRLTKKEEDTNLAEVKNNLPKEISAKIKRILSDDALSKFFDAKISFAKEQSNPRFQLGLLARIVLSCLLDADRISAADFDLPDKKIFRSVYSKANIILLWDKLAIKLDLSIEKFQKIQVLTEKHRLLNQIRQEISDMCFDFADNKNGIYQLTVPTGGGKTLASLRFALKHAKRNGMKKIIYVIPYTSIIDQNADVARKIFEERSSSGSIVLEHHSNLTPERETSNQKILAESWDAPIIFTTMVQFLNTLFASGTKSTRRMHQLANAVIIIDEIQSLPIRCVHLFNGAVNFLVNFCSSTILLCSATQPLLHKLPYEKHSLKIDEAQKIFTDKDKLFEKLRRVDVENCCRDGGWDISSITEMVKIEESSSVLVITNTKNVAKEIFTEIKKCCGYKIFHLSTNMCPQHRIDILDEIKNNLEKNKLKRNFCEPIICVSTQLIEAGVDLDFGCVVRYLAGLDSIVQAAGRCNREGKQEQNGKLLIVNAKNENLDKLPDIKQGALVTERILREYANNPNTFDHDIIGEKAIERYYRYYFYDRKELMDYKLSVSKHFSRDDTLFNLLSNNKVSQDTGNEKSKLLLPQSFKKANELFEVIESNPQGVIVPYKDGEEIIKTLFSDIELTEQYELLKKSQRYSVNMFSYLFQKLYSLKIIHETQTGSGIFYLDKQYYSADYGIDENIVNEMDVYIE